MFSFRLENEQSQIGERRDALFFFLYFDAHILHNGCIILERNFYPLTPSLTLSTYSFPWWETKSKKGKITYTYSGMSECSFWLSVLINLCNQISFTSFSSFLLILLFEQQQMIMMMGGKNTHTHTGFDEYYKSLRPPLKREVCTTRQSNVEHKGDKKLQINCRNIWFNEFWSQHHKCSFEPDDRLPRCTGNETLVNYEQEGLVPFVGNWIFITFPFFFSIISPQQEKNIDIDTKKIKSPLNITFSFFNRKRSNLFEPSSDCAPFRTCISLSRVHSF